MGLPRSLGPRYTRVWIANGVSGLGDGITAAAGPLLMTTVTADPRLISAAVAAQQLPALLLSLPMGALVDRFDKRRVAIGADLLRTLTSGILAMLVATGHVTVPAIYTLLFFEGIGAIADRTSGAALVPGLIAPEDIPAANNRQFATSSLTVFLVGPPIGAALFLADRWVPFTVDAVSFFGSMLLLVGLAWQEVPNEGERLTLRADVRAGLRFLFGHPALRTLALCIFVMNIVFGADISILVIYAERHLHAGARGFGLLLTAVAVGGLCMAPFTARLIRRFGMRWLLRIGLTMEALTHLGLGLSPTIVVAYSVMFAFGLHDAVWNVVTSSLRQRETPAGMQGRTAATTSLFSIGGNAVGAVLGGIEVATWGILAPFWIGTVVVSVLVVVAWRPFAHTDV